ncbi:HK97 family phage prohead protease [Methylomonas sp. MED-D]|uniref:HK97 family phage prohead protease n=1 Tax=Methylomonas sp. MED-D TaxID=3418768 RepID=UPI003D04CA4D
MKKNRFGPPTETKTQKLSACEIKIDGAGVGKFSGYASVFNGVDSYGDTILPGAYAETLRTTWPKMFVNHDSWDLPVGKWLDIQEDSTGLFVTGEFTPGNSESADTYAALKHGTIDGLSIGYVLKSGDYEDRTDGPDGYGSGRIIKNVSRLVEISLVTFPADDAARVSNVKSEIDTLETITDFERYLRDLAGLTRGEALHFVTRFKAAALSESVPALDYSKMLARINQFSQNLG